VSAAVLGSVKPLEPSFMMFAREHDPPRGRCAVQHASIATITLIKVIAEIELDRVVLAMLTTLYNGLDNWHIEPPVTIRH
jgi:hypothetical protein